MRGIYMDSSLRPHYHPYLSAGKRGYRLQHSVEARLDEGFEHSHGGVYVASKDLSRLNLDYCPRLQRVKPASPICILEFFSRPYTSLRNGWILMDLRTGNATIILLDIATGYRIVLFALGNCARRNFAQIWIAWVNREYPQPLVLPTM